MRILIVDDERNIRRTLSACLTPLGHEVTEAGSSQEAAKAVVRKRFDLAFLDLRLGGDDGLHLLPSLLDAQPRLAVVVITAHATIETAVQAVKLGAEDYLPKPFTPAQVRLVVDKVGGKIALRHRVDDLESRLADAAPQLLLDTGSEAMSTALDYAELAAQSDAAVLLRGESGTGKGVLARFIHERSERRAQPFVVVSCPTLNDELLASELFGHARGAFTGAVKDTPGRVEVADGGTLFLDEVGEISPQLQTKLLRFTQDREYERVGDTTTRQADVRIIAATNRDLEADVEAGRFRLDLLYRLNVVELTVPPLRARSEDLIALAEHFLAFFSKKMGRAVPTLTDEGKAALLSYSWPGNIRELRNEAERAIVLARRGTLGSSAFSGRIATTPLRAEPGTAMTLEELERLHIERVLARTTTREEAAEWLGIDVSTLWRKRKRYGLDE